MILLTKLYCTATNIKNINAANLMVIHSKGHFQAQVSAQCTMVALYPYTHTDGAHHPTWQMVGSLNSFLVFNYDHNQGK